MEEGIDEFVEMKASIAEDEGEFLLRGDLVTGVLEKQQSELQ
jgi:hypothetical protein